MNNSRWFGLLGGVLFLISTMLLFGSSVHGAWYNFPAEAVNGIAFTFADSAFAFAANSFGRVAVSINSNMIFSKAAQLGETIFAEAKPLNITHKTADFDVDITNEKGDIYYRFRGTVYRSSKNVIENG